MCSSLRAASFLLTGIKSSLARWGAAKSAPFLVFVIVPSTVLRSTDPAITQRNFPIICRWPTRGFVGHVVGIELDKGFVAAEQWSNCSDSGDVICEQRNAGKHAADARPAY